MEASNLALAEEAISVSFNLVIGIERVISGASARVDAVAVHKVY